MESTVSLPDYAQLAVGLLKTAQHDVVGTAAYGETPAVDIGLKTKGRELTLTELTDLETACEAIESSVLRITSVVRQLVEIERIGRPGPPEPVDWPRFWDDQ